MAQMHLMQIFIPTTDREGGVFPPKVYTALKKELTDLFGGVTIYARSPVKGVWKPASDFVETDNMIIYEVLIPKADLSYWSTLKSRLEADFRQQEILMRYFDVSTVK
jgi:hypothetical protein